MHDPDWLDQFHAGHRATLEDCYRQHFATASRGVGQVLSGADRETVVHEVFYRMLTSSEMRRGFHGGSFPAWIATVARNQAVDYVRRYGREQSVAPEVAARLADRVVDEDLDARRLVDEFRRDHLPKEWAAVFDARFLRQLSQREAAAALGIPRTTLAYQEMRIRRLLRRFFLS